MSTPDRLALRRRPDKTFVLFGAVISETKSDVTLVMPDGTAATHRKAGLMFVDVGSLNHFARLDPAGLNAAFDRDPQAVFEQALVDSIKAVAVAELKQKLVHAGLPSVAVDRAWDSVRKSVESSANVKVSGGGAGRKLAWSGERSTRLGAHVTQGVPTAPVDPDGAAEGRAAQAVGDNPPLAPSPAPEALDLDDGARVAHPADAEPATDEPAVARPASDGNAGADSPPQAGLIPTLSALLGAAAPKSLAELAGSTLRLGSALSGVPNSDLKALAEMPDGERDLLALPLLARERAVRLWPGMETVLPDVASEALESAVGEASRVPETRAHFARFASRVLERTVIDEIPLALVCTVFVRAASCEDSSEPSRTLTELAGVLAERTKISVAQEWANADDAIPDIARGMNRIPLDGDGPRAQFLASLYEIRRQHLAGDLLWKNIDMTVLDRAAGGALRRALLDEDISDRIVKPAVLRFAGDCRTRHGLGSLIALRGSFAQYIDDRLLSSVMDRVAKEDRRAREWWEGLRQQRLLDAAVAEQASATAAADQAMRAAEESERRAARAAEDRDAAVSALHRASQANAQASDAQMRQAKLDVLKSLANLVVTIKSSAAAQDDPALLQRVGFALRREGLTEIAPTGATVKYDPVLHDAQGEHIDPGASVSVGRPGYTYDSGDEELVLVKAHVSAL